MAYKNQNLVDKLVQNKNLRDMINDYVGLDQEAQLKFENRIPLVKEFVKGLSSAEIGEALGRAQYLVDEANETNLKNWGYEKDQIAELKKEKFGKKWEEEKLAKQAAKDEKKRSKEEKWKRIKEIKQKIKEIDQLIKQAHYDVSNPGAIEELDTEKTKLSEELNKLMGSIEAGQKTMLITKEEVNGTLDVYWDPEKKQIEELKTFNDEDEKPLTNIKDFEELDPSDDWDGEILDKMHELGLINEEGELIEAEQTIWLSQVFFKYKDKNGNEKSDQVWARTSDTNNETITETAKRKAAQLFEGEIYDLHINPPVKATESYDLQIGSVYDEELLESQGYRVSVPHGDNVVIWEPDNDGWWAERQSDGTLKVIRQYYESDPNVKHSLQAAQKMFYIKKYEGDDMYSWAVFKRGQEEPVASGESRSGAQYHADQLNKKYEDKNVESMNKITFDEFKKIVFEKYDLTEEQLKESYDCWGTYEDYAEYNIRNKEDLLKHIERAPESENWKLKATKQIRAERETVEDFKKRIADYTFEELGSMVEPYRAWRTLTFGEEKYKALMEELEKKESTAIDADERPITVTEDNHDQQQKQNEVDEAIDENKDFDKELERGTKVEEEHKTMVEWLKKVLKDTGTLPSDKEIFKHIALDHITEFPNYYDGLEEMEKELSQKATAAITTKSGVNAALNLLHRYRYIKELAINSKLIQKHNAKTNKKEWALVSKSDSSKVLKWFGTEKPSDERVKKEEKRVQYFKNVKGESEIDKMRRERLEKASKEDITKWIDKLKYAMEGFESENKALEEAIKDGVNVNNLKIQIANNKELIEDRKKQIVQMEEQLKKIGASIDEETAEIIRQVIIHEGRQAALEQYGLTQVEEALAINSAKKFSEMTDEELTSYIEQYADMGDQLTDDDMKYLAQAEAERKRRKMSGSYEEFLNKIAPAIEALELATHECSKIVQRDFFEDYRIAFMDDGIIQVEADDGTDLKFAARDVDSNTGITDALRDYLKKQIDILIQNKKIKAYSFINQPAAPTGLNTDKGFTTIAEALREIDEAIESIRHSVVDANDDTAKLVLMEYNGIKKEILKLYEKKSDLKEKVDQMISNFKLLRRQ